jgi:hypothetical protein
MDLSQLESATLDELKAAFPQQWNSVGQQLVSATETKRPEALAEFVQQHLRASAPWRAQLAAKGHNKKWVAGAMLPLASARMAKLAAEHVLGAVAVQAATGQPAGRVRLGLWSGKLIQRLLFSHGLQRKPVSMKWFRWLWPLVRQRRMLMLLVQPKGIYCFYSQELIAALAVLIGQRPSVELAAGDGTLSRFLQAKGVSVKASDNQSWKHAISYADDVELLSATDVLIRDNPKVVLCSFPPPKNDFERRIFETPSVELYIVITSQHRFAAGDWDSYDKQKSFAMIRDTELSKLVLPPELDPAVLVFRRV